MYCKIKHDFAYAFVPHKKNIFLQAYIEDEYYKILKEYDSYYKIKIDKYNYGYIQKEYVKVLSDDEVMVDRL